MGLMKVDIEGKCHKRVYPPGAFVVYSHQCTRTIKNYEDGFGWCKQHTPSVRKAREAKRFVAYTLAHETEADLIRTRNALLVAVCNAETDNLPLCVRNAVNKYRKARS